MIRLIQAIVCMAAVAFFSGASLAQEQAGKESRASEPSQAEVSSKEEKSRKSSGLEPSLETKKAQQDPPPPPAKSATPQPADQTKKNANTLGVSGEDYQLRLRSLERQVDELKERIRQSHTRLSLLSDTILAGASGGARTEIEFENDLSGAWRLVEAVFVLDGAVQYRKSDESGSLAQQKKIPIFSGTIPAGHHTLQVLLKLKGHGFGVFSYLQGLDASAKSSHAFTVADGDTLSLQVTAWEQGGPTTPVEEQPTIRFAEMNGGRLNAGAKKSAAGSSQNQSVDTATTETRSDK